MSTPLDQSFKRVLEVIDSLPPSSPASAVINPICGFLSNLSVSLHNAFVAPSVPPSAMRPVRPRASFSEPVLQAGASSNGRVKAKPVSNGGDRGSPYRRPEHPVPPQSPVLPLSRARPEALGASPYHPPSGWAPPLLRAHPEGGRAYPKPVPTYKTFAQIPTYGTFANADTALSKVSRIEPGNRKVMLTTAKGKLIVIDHEDDNMAYVAYDPVQGMQVCFPESHPDLPHALEFNQNRKWGGLSESKMFLYFRPAFTTDEAESIATDKWETIMEKFRNDNIDSDIQYPSVRHPSNDVAWVSVESIVAQVPRKQWTGDGTFDPSAVYEGLGFESILEQVPLD